MIWDALYVVNTNILLHSYVILPNIIPHIVEKIALFCFSLDLVFKNITITLDMFIWFIAGLPLVLMKYMAYQNIL